ncbi:uncharacterized protein LOC111311643 [Durio zibethinus]|uniref:Uncharacterized protein LOC111311643 n=1 Tax=Durio zibethinus TaxID=66656 RepID=A0A6P6APW8_DURZI|nr:uncharacterized protein LOC111311643 [Durio zibethinus]
MVAFTGRKYAARSLPAFVANGTYSVTSFTLMLEFKKGRLQNLYWKRDDCAQCSGKSNFVCLNKQDCAVNTNSCKNHGGSVDCSLGIQLAFSGTDKHLSALNSCMTLACHGWCQSQPQTQAQTGFSLGACYILKSTVEGWCMLLVNAGASCSSRSPCHGWFQSQIQTQAQTRPYCLVACYILRSVVRGWYLFIVNAGGCCSSGSTLVTAQNIC